MTEQEVQRIAEEAACKAVRQTFRLFGVDTNDQNSVNDFRSDLVHARKMRRMWDGATGRVSMGIIVAVSIAGIVWAADWIKAFFGVRT